MRRIIGFCIAGTHSGCGKTTVSLGIMSALSSRGLKVQPFKVGPDFIDPGHHMRVTGRHSHNLDGWIMERDYIKYIFSIYTQDADVATVEGVMGLFDGFSPKDESGSTAEVSKLLGIPVILVIDAGSMAGSCAAIAMGFKNFDPELPLKGVIFNRVGSPVHETYLRDAMKHKIPELPVLGSLPRVEHLRIPSRHLGLVTDQDMPLTQDKIQALIEWVEQGVDLDWILNHMWIDEHTIWTHDKRMDPHGRHERARIGIAMDEAFCFYYQDNLRLLREAGAIRVPFSPLRDSGLPEGIKGIILGGGYPELYGKELSENRGMIKDIRDFALSGGPIYAECGGFMYLTEAIKDMNGNEHEMVGIFPLKGVMRSKLNSLGYRKIMTTEPSLLGPEGITARGHEFHYSFLEGEIEAIRRIYRVCNRMDSSWSLDGFIVKNTLGSYIHLHWGSNPRISENFVKYCKHMPWK